MKLVLIPIIILALSLPSAFALSITAPQNILSVTTNSSRNIPDLGTPIILENATITNNSTGNFKIGTTVIQWIAISNETNATAYQNVTVILAPNPTTPNNRIAMINYDDSRTVQFTFGNPIMEKYGIQATYFVECGKVAIDSTYMTWDMVHKLIAEGNDIQSHTMTHLHPDHLSQAQLDYEYGGAKKCFVENGIPVHMVATPYGEGDTNMTVVQTIERYYDMARAGHSHVWNMHCALSGQTNCFPYNTTTGQLQTWNKFNIQFYSQDSVLANTDYNDSQTFYQFIKEVNNVKTKTTTPISFPIVVFHKVGLVSSLDAGMSTKLLDAEMKYLKDNSFKTITYKDLHYNATSDWFYLQ